jgi:enamine deaminase RidA (YjgF/YER057c/UK114 family)
MAQHQSFVPDGVAPPFGDGYVHAVAAGGAIYVSGQVGVDPDGTIPEGFEAQARRAFANLEAVLAAAGAELADVVKVTVLLVDGDDLPAYRTVRETFLAHRPASTLMVVKALALPELRFEIEAIAVAG